MWPKRKSGLSPFAVRVWLVAALIALVSALILGANLVLLGYAQPGSDPVGKLTPARLMQIEHELPDDQDGIAPGVIPQPLPHEKDIAGEDSDD